MSNQPNQGSHQGIPKIALTARQLAIVAQLYTTRMDLLLKEHKTSLSQFGLLNHLANSPKEQSSISELTEAMEINQPGVTKIVKKLSEEKLVSIAHDANDSRKRLVSITPSGYDKIKSISMALFPDVSQWFADWEDDEIDAFTNHLSKLAKWFDSNRLTSD